ncbi:MAG TPA: uridine kinase [Chloroflexaceae bacterium]|nr:uridine kinase [Chloroflexaceae bacterium]
MDGTRPLMLGLVGDSASGKTTLVRGVVRLLGHNGVTPICLDDYHRYSRPELASRGLTAADPEANDLSLMAEHLAALRAGGTIRKPVYDHRSGTLRGPETVAATGLVVAYGMLTLTPAALADLFDLTVYLEPDEALRRAWRLERDVRERGYTPQEVLALRAARERDAARFIAVQRPRAAAIVRFHGAPDGAPGGLAVELTLRRGQGAQPLAPALDALASAALPGLALSREVSDEDGHLADRLTIEPAVGAAAAHAAALITDGLVGPRPVALDALGQVRGPAGVWHSPPLALTQLLIVRRLIAP